MQHEQCNIVTFEMNRRCNNVIQCQQPTAYGYVGTCYQNEISGKDDPHFNLGRDGNHICIND